MASKALDLLEQRIEEGSASSQEVTTVARYAFEAEKLRLEREKLEEENKLLKAKTEAIQSQKHVEELFQEAIRAMKDYSGHGDEYDEDDEDDFYDD